MNSIHFPCRAAHEEEREAEEQGHKKHTAGKPWNGFEGQSETLHYNASKEHSQGTCRQIYSSCKGENGTDHHNSFSNETKTTLQWEWREMSTLLPVQDACSHVIAKEGPEPGILSTTFAWDGNILDVGSLCIDGQLFHVYAILSANHAGLLAGQGFQCIFKKNVLWEERGSTSDWFIAGMGKNAWPSPAQAPPNYGAGDSNFFHFKNNNNKRLKDSGKYNSDFPENLGKSAKSKAAPTPE